MFLKRRIKNIMKKSYNKNGYLETIQKGLKALGILGRKVSSGKGSREERIELLKNKIQNADAVVIGAGAGLSTSAGFTYSGERFEKYFFDFIKEYGIRDMYSGGFYPFPNDEIRWAWWARHIYFNRYVKAPKPVYDELFSLLKDKDYFVITTNVDHQFQKAGFDKKRLFYTQGDYGLFQSVNLQIQKTYDNEGWIMKAMEVQGFVKNENEVFSVPESREILMRIPAELIPKCPDDGSDMTTNLRVDSSFVEDEGWYTAAEKYSEFLENHKNMHVLFLELGVGANTPVIIKYPFWYMVMENKKAVYACINYQEAFCPNELEERSICLEGDIGEVLKEIRKK
jgi:sir2 silent information regulator family NAD-dependent deacetylase